MKRKRFSVEQIVAVLKQAEVGVPVAELIRQVGISGRSDGCSLQQSVKGMSSGPQDDLTT